jgi:hypothetical protein
MNEPQFIAWHEIEIIHEISIERFGGSQGIRDEHLIHSALGAAMNDFYYAAADLAGIAAAYAFHIAQAQAFLDGNNVLRLVPPWCFWSEVVWKPGGSGVIRSTTLCMPWRRREWTSRVWQN